MISAARFLRWSTVSLVGTPSVLAPLRLAGGALFVEEPRTEEPRPEDRGLGGVALDVDLEREDAAREVDALLADWGREASARDAAARADFFFAALARAALALFFAALADCFVADPASDVFFDVFFFVFFVFFAAIVFT